MGKQKKRRDKRCLERKGTYQIKDIFNAISQHMFDCVREDGTMNPKRKVRVLFDGDYIKANSQRYQVFFYSGMKCVNCGIEGKFFAKEKKNGDTSYHLNLYGLDKEGNEVLMTKDHIIPRCKGGKNSFFNYQCMCKQCNEKKGGNYGEAENC